MNRTDALVIPPLLPSLYTPAVSDTDSGENKTPKTMATPLEIATVALPFERVSSVDSSALMPTSTFITAPTLSRTDAPTIAQHIHGSNPTFIVYAATQPTAAGASSSTANAIRSTSAATITGSKALDAHAIVVDYIIDHLHHSHYHLHDGPLDASQIRTLQNQLDEPRERLQLLTNAATVLTAAEIMCIESGDMDILANKLSGEAGLDLLARPIVSCPIAGTIVIGANILALEALLSNGGWEGMASRAVTTTRTDSYAAGHGTEDMSLGSFVSTGVGADAPASLTKRHSILEKPQTNVVIPTNTLSRIADHPSKAVTETHKGGVFGDRVNRGRMRSSTMESGRRSMFFGASFTVPTSMTHTLIRSGSTNASDLVPSHTRVSSNSNLNNSSSNYAGMSEKTSPSHPLNYPDVVGSNRLSYISRKSTSTFTAIANRLSGIRPTLTENMYTLYANMEDPICQSVAEVVKSLLSPHEYCIFTEPLEARQVNMLQHLLEETERHTLCHDINKVLTIEEITKVSKGDSSVLSKLLSGSDGLTHLARPILVCSITGTLVIGNQIEEIRALLRDQGWKNGRVSLTRSTTRSILTSPDPSYLNESLKIDTCSIITEKSVTNRGMPTQVKYIIYCDIEDAESSIMCNMMINTVPENQFKIVTGPLDQREIKAMQHNMDESERHTLCMNSESVFTASDLLKIRQGDMNILAVFLSSPNGLPYLSRPIVMCPINGCVITRCKPDQLDKALLDDGWSKSGAATVTVNTGRTIQQTLVGLRLASGIGNALTIKTQPMPQSPLGTTAKSADHSPTISPTLETKSRKASSAHLGDVIASKSKYLYFHDESNPKSHSLLDLLRKKSTNTDIEVHTQSLTATDIKPLLHLLDPKEHSNLLARKDLLSAEELAQVRSGNPSALINVLTGPDGAANLARPIIVCPILGTILIGFKPNELETILSEQAWGTCETWGHLPNRSSTTHIHKGQAGSRRGSTSIGAVGENSKQWTPMLESTTETHVGNTQTNPAILSSLPSSDKLEKFPSAQVSQTNVYNAANGATASASTTLARPSRQSGTVPAQSTQPAHQKLQKYILYHDQTDKQSLKVLQLLESTANVSEYTVISTPILTPRDIRSIQHMLDPADRLDLCRSTKNFLTSAEIDRVKNGDISLLAERLGCEAGALNLLRPIFCCPVAGRAIIGAKINEIKNILSTGDHGW